MLVEDAFIAGSLGQAVFAANGVYNIIDAAPKAESRPARDNDLFFFRHAGFDAIPAHPEGLPVTIEELNHRLIEETSLYRGLDCLLVGMDPDMSDETRILSIRGADEVLRSDAAIAARIRDRFLVPVSADEWDPESALALARDHDAGNAASCYRLLADGIVDRIVEDIARTVAEQYGAGIEASENRTLLLGCGLVAELARIEDEGDRSSASHLMFDAGRFPGMQALNRRTQILATLGKSLLERLPETEDGVSADEIADRGADAHHDPNQSADPIIVAVDRFMDADKTSDHRRNALAYVDLSAIQRQVDWIGGRLRDGRTQQAENALLELVGQQEGRSRPSDVVKTLTAVADLARRTRQFDLMRRILSAIDRTGASDGAAMVVRAYGLVDTGRLPDALAALDQTIERFPENVVARTARAETLRDLGRLDEALAALDQTIERFPENVVARTARAETLRDLGRLDEALAALDQTIERFPEDVVARTARAETLRDLGRLDEALAALDQTIERFPEDVVARTARAETLRDLGRLDEALAALDQTIERFPENVVARTARAETLRDLGRLDEALAALDQTIERFPENVVARTARAETLRDLGRLDEALAALDQTIERFPEDVVARTARAETLRDLGRLDEALAALDQTIERFPEDVVARTARAETLRDLGRLDEALAALDQTIERFPENVVARNASAHLLQMLGEFARAEKLLADAASRPTTRSDWIAKHIVAMTRLRAGRVDDALSSLEEGVANCPFRDVRPYFLTARAVARLAAKQSEDAVVETEGLAQDPALPQPLATNILLIRAHAHAEAGREQEARNLVRNPQIIDLAAARQKRLAETLARRYGLDGGEPAQGESAKDLERQILALETDLLSASRLAA